MLTNAAAKAAGAKDRAYKLTDQGGLHLLVRPTGTKSWQQKYRFASREKLLTLGQFPDISINRARILQGEAKELLERGLDPAKAGAKIDTLEKLARAWWRSRRPAWSPAHAADVLASLERDLFPELGNMVCASVTAPQLLAALRSIEARGCAVTAHRVRQRLSEIFAFGKAEGLISVNPADDLGAAMLAAPPARPHPALETIEQCRELLAACDSLSDSACAKRASRFLALTGVRWAAVRWARWEEIDWEKRIWTVPAARMKLSQAKKSDARHDHVVPLSAAAQRIVSHCDSIRVAPLRIAVSNEGANLKGLIFPGRNADQPLGDGALRDLYQRTQFAGRHVPHGWRASFSTILNIDLGREWNLDIEEALGHAVKGKVEGAYNRSVQLERRRAVFDRWGELLTT